MLARRARKGRDKEKSQKLKKVGTADQIDALYKPRNKNYDLKSSRPREKTTPIGTTDVSWKMNNETTKENINPVNKSVAFTLKLKLTQGRTGKAKPLSRSTVIGNASETPDKKRNCIQANIFTN